MNPTTTIRSYNSWTKEEDELLLKLIPKGDDTRLAWKSICKDFKTKNYKQCREHYFNKLRDGLQFGKWTKEDDEKIVRLQKIHGNKWSLISKQFEGRSSNAIKNRYFGHIKKFGIADDTASNTNTNNTTSSANGSVDIINQSPMTVFTPADKSTYNVV